MNVEELKQLLHEQNEAVFSYNIPEVINSVMTLYEKGVEVGMEIGRQIKINQACEWLENELYEVMTEPNPYYISEVQSKSYNSLEVLINDFKKAMEL